MPDRASIDVILQTLARHPFRAKFHLRGRDAATVQLRGMEVIREHAAELLARRVAAAGQGRQADAVPGASGVRRPARHCDVLPHLPSAMARDPQGARAHRRRAGLCGRCHLPLDRERPGGVGLARAALSRGGLGPRAGRLTSCAWTRARSLRDRPVKAPARCPAVRARPVRQAPNPPRLSARATVVFPYA